jgi:hypothetical protein
MVDEVARLVINLVHELLLVNLRGASSRRGWMKGRIM